MARVTGSFGKLCHIDRSLGLLHAVGEFDNDSVVVCMSFWLDASPFMKKWGDFIKIDKWIPFHKPCYSNGIDDVMGKLCWNAVRNKS